MADKVTTGARLKELMSEQNLKQVDLVDRCKPLTVKYGVEITKSNISQWTNDKYAPDQLRLQILSEALRVSPAWLMGFDVPKELIDASREKRKSDALKFIRTEATKEEKLELLKELASEL